MSDIVGRCNSPSDISGDDHDFDHTDMILIFDEKYNKAECMVREDLMKLYQGVNVWQTDIKLVKLPYMGVWVMGADRIPEDRIVFVLEKVVPGENEKVRTRRAIVNQHYMELSNHGEHKLNEEERRRGKEMSPSEEREINTCLLIGSYFGVSQLHEAREIVRKLVPADTSIDWVRDIEERGRSRVVGERKVEEVQPYVMTEEDRRRQQEMNEIRERRPQEMDEIREQEMDEIRERRPMIQINNPEITHLPPLPPNLKILDCSGCSSLVELPVIPGLEELVCYDCESLTHIPVIPGLKILACQECVNLTHIPIIPGLKELWCSRCTSLTHIPMIPELEVLSCSGCTSLVELPPLPPSLKILNCNRCTSLVELPPLPPGLEELNCVGCVSIRVWPVIPEGTSCQGCP